MRIAQAVIKDESKRIMQETIFSWERREERGRREGIQQIAKKMLAKGMEIGTNCDLNGLSFEQLRNGVD